MNRALALALLVLAAGAVPARADVTVSAAPGLYPAFRRDVTDYVSRCGDGRPLRLSVTASGGERVAVAGHTGREGHFTVALNRRAGAAMSLRVLAQRHNSTYHVRCLPPDFPGWVSARHGAPQAEWYVVTPV